MRDRPMKGVIVTAVLLAGSLCAPCQSTFIVQFDSVQSGHDASGRSIMETENGLIVFAWQHSDDGTGRMRGAVYKLAPDGTFLSRYEVGTGELTGSYFGRWDPVTRMNTGGFASMFVRSNGYGYNIDMIRFDDNGDVLSFNDVMDSARRFDRGRIPAIAANRGWRIRLLRSVFPSRWICQSPAGEIGQRRRGAMAADL